MDTTTPLAGRLTGLAKRAAVTVERAWDAAWLARTADRPPRHFRIETYLGHGAGDRTVVRGRVLDNAEPPSASRGEGTGAAARRTLARFLTRELPGVPLRITLGTATVETTTDAEGYVDVRVEPGLTPDDGPWAEGRIELAAPYRGLPAGRSTAVRVRVPGRQATVGIISDVDDTIVHTGAQRTLEMVTHTFTGSSITRTPMPGAPELYRALAAGSTGDEANPVFYVSSSPWNLHGFLAAFLEHRAFPMGPLMLRDLLGSGGRRSHADSKLRHIAEVLGLHPRLPFVLLGDSGQHDPEIYAEAVRRHPGRIRAIYIREVRLDPGDGRVEKVTDAWDADVPFVLAADSAAIARHAAGLGLISAADAATVQGTASAES
jgi:phosphatidate phosphatase APP1